MSRQSENILAKYLPPGALEPVMRLLRSEPLELKIKPPRSTKFGDYRFPNKNGRHRISINSDLNPYAFLVTLLHEMAHLVAFKQFGRTIKPHGKEWQNSFIKLSEPFICSGIFPEELGLVLRRSLQKGSSSSCTDHDLYRELLSYDKNPGTRLEELPDGTIFSLKNMLFRKGPRARKRFRCLNLNNKREYMIHALAEVVVQNDKINKSA